MVARSLVKKAAAAAVSKPPTPLLFSSRLLSSLSVPTIFD
jgi:hypothetical protein